MFGRIASTALAALLLTPVHPAAAQPTPAPTPATLSATETKAVGEIAAMLNQRYPSPAAAEKAGYVRYTNEDDTGAISYADREWNSTSEERPSQLWYDVNGRLLGADYSVLADGHPTPPALFGIAPSRFFEEHAHIHYVVRNPDGSLTYSRAVGAKKYAAAGLDVQHPTAAGLVKVGAVDSPDRVATVFLFPHIWDVTIWVLPNPDGAFADKNPNVKPAHSPSPMDMH
ncbi:MAG: hypothetical protein ABSB70_17655 [Candidatus Velthaea sp.]|jgi:hypothetical protein